MIIKPKSIGDPVAVVTTPSSVLEHMDLSHEERKAAFHKLQLDSERFWAQADANNSTIAELIHRFLRLTDSTLSEEERLISFAGQVSNHWGWIGYCQVNEYIVANKPDSAYYTYATWITSGRAFIKNDESFSLEEHIRIAADVEAIIERATQETDYAPEQSLAWFYYEHPLKAEQSQMYLLKSKEWFERFIDTDDFNECDHHDLQMLGHVYFELGDFRTALHWFKRFEATEHRCHETCVLDQKLSEKRFVECQQLMQGMDD